MNRYTIEGTSTIPSGTHQVGWNSTMTAAAWQRAAPSRCTWTAKVGEGRVDQTEPLIFSTDETFDIGFQSGSPSSTDYGARTTSSAVRSTGWRSISARMRSISIISSRPKTACVSPWRGSKASPGAEPPPAAGKKRFWSVRFLGQGGHCQTPGVFAVRAAGEYR